MTSTPLGSSKIGARFQVTIPKDARKRFGLRVGDIVVFVKEDGKLILTNSVTLE